jgi:enediyne biosynthesis protein E4
MIAALLLTLAPTGDDPWFAEGAAEAGLVWSHQSGATGQFLYPEGLGGGCALFDYDGDGDLDVYFVQSGALEDGEAPRPTNRLFSNRGDGTFEDVTQAAGVGDNGYGMGVAAGDYDGDGDVDLYVVNLGPNVLYRNEGDGTFKDVSTEAGVGDGRFGGTAAFFDADGDGDLDLFLVNNLNWSRGLERECTNQQGERDYCGPGSLDARSTDVLYLNEGGRFRDISEQAGLLATTGNGLGLVVADDDLDGDLDVYVANDATPNALWRNHGVIEGIPRFKDQALRSGCSVNGSGAAEAGMGVQWLDLDGDLDLDLILTHLRGESNTCYLQTRGRYRDRTRATGLLVPSLRPTGFGLGAHDFDTDGLLDLLVFNGAIQTWPAAQAPSASDPYAEFDQLFRGTGPGRFEELPRAVLGSTAARASRGAAFGDLDGDGDLDAVVVDRDAPARLLWNVAPRDGAWIGLELMEHGRTAIGAQVRLVCAPEEGPARSQLRLVARAYGYFASNDPRVHFGIPAGHRVRGIWVRWPGETAEVELGPREAGRYHRLTREP